MTQLTRAAAGRVVTPSSNNLGVSSHSIKIASYMSTCRCALFHPIVNPPGFSNAESS